MKNVISVLLALSVALMSGAVLAQSQKMAAELIQGQLLTTKGPHETRPTLDPRLFARNPYVANTYKIAKEIPRVLDKLFCYCYCETNPRFKHKSLLSCYTDNHASQCGICMNEAVVAMKMTKEGKTPAQISALFKEKFLK